MTAVTLDGYFVRVRKKNKREPLPLGDFDDGASLPRIIHGYLQQLAQGGATLPDLLKSARVDRLQVDGAFCTGVLSVGEYGFETKIINTDTGTLSYKKQKPDADMIPHFFDFCMPEAARRGIVLLQRVGLHGIKTLLRQLIVDRFRSEYDEHMLDLNPLVPAEALRQYLEKGQVQKVRFIQHGIPPDIANRLGGGARQRGGEIEYSITLREKGWYG